MKPTVGKTTKDNSKRRYPGMGGRRHNPVTIKAKRAEALERQAAWAALSLREQLAALDRRLGEGVGAARQRSRLTTLLRTERGRLAKVDLLSVDAPAADSGKLKAKDRRRLERGRSDNDTR